MVFTRTNAYNVDVQMFHSFYQEDVMTSVEKAIANTKAKADKAFESGTVDCGMSSDLIMDELLGQIDAYEARNKQGSVKQKFRGAKRC